jgi:hypothetical protein
MRRPCSILLPEAVSVAPTVIFDTSNTLLFPSSPDAHAKAALPRRCSGPTRVATLSLRILAQGRAAGAPPRDSQVNPLPFSLEPEIPREMCKI